MGLLTLDVAEGLRAAHIRQRDAVYAIGAVGPACDLAAPGRGDETALVVVDVRDGLAYVLDSRRVTEHVKRAVAGWRWAAWRARRRRDLRLARLMAAVRASRRARGIATLRRRGAPDHLIT